MNKPTVYCDITIGGRGWVVWLERQGDHDFTIGFFDTVAEASTLAWRLAELLGAGDVLNGTYDR